MNENNIGISTLSLNNVSFSDAAKAIREAGFSCIELYLNSVKGKPLIWPRIMTYREKYQWKSNLDTFSKIIVHVNLQDVDINSLNPGFRDEAERQYLEYLDFACKIGASTCTFHPGFLSIFGDANEKHFRDTFERNVEFAKILTEKIANKNVKVGYEITDLRERSVYGFRFKGFDVDWLDYYIDLVDAVNDAKFGLGLDVPKVALATKAKNETELVDKIEYFRKKLLVVHAHGLYAEICTMRPYFDLRRNNRIDYAKVLFALRSIDFEEPVILRIRMKDLDTTLEKCKEFRDFIAREAI